MPACPSDQPETETVADAPASASGKPGRVEALALASHDVIAAVPAEGPRLTKTTGGSTSVRATFADERAVTVT